MIFMTHGENMKYLLKMQLQTVYSCKVEICLHLLFGLIIGYLFLQVSPGFSSAFIIALYFWQRYLTYYIKSNVTSKI